MRFGLTEVFGYPLLMRAFRGETEGIKEGVESMRASVQESTDPQYAQMMVWLDTAVALAEGRPEDVAGLVPQDLKDPTYGSLAYAMAGHAALWLRDPRLAKRALAGLDAMEIRGRIIDATRRTVQAGIAALEGSPGEAASGFVDAARQLREIGLQLPVGLTQLDAVATLGAEGPAGRGAADEAREIFTRLRAEALLARLELMLAESRPAPAAKARKAAAPSPATVSRSA